jgi:hypothetical protein
MDFSEMCLQLCIAAVHRRFVALQVLQRMRSGLG